MRARRPHLARLHSLAAPDRQRRPRRQPGRHGSSATWPACASSRSRSIRSACCTSTIDIPVLRFDAPACRPAAHATARNNWTFKKQRARRRSWKPRPRARGADRRRGAPQGRRDQGRRHAPTCDTLDNDTTYGVGWKMSGTYQRRAGDGRRQGRRRALAEGADHALPDPGRHAHRPHPHRAEGTVTSRPQLAAIDLQLKLAGASMARLYELHRHAAAGNAGLLDRRPPDRQARRRTAAAGPTTTSRARSARATSAASSNTRPASRAASCPAMCLASSWYSPTWRR